MVPEQTLFALLQNDLKRVHFAAFQELKDTLRDKDAKVEKLLLKRFSLRERRFRVSQASGLLPKSAIRSTLAAALSGGGGTSGMKALQLRDLVDACLEW